MPSPLVSSSSAAGVPRRRVYSSVNLGRDRRQGWQDLINELYGSLDIDVGDGSTFRGEIRRSSLGRSELTQITTDGEIANRLNRHIAKDSNDFFLFGMSISGEATYEQYGRESRLPPHHFGLIYTASPYLFAHRENINTVCLKIPAAALQGRVADPHALCSISRMVTPGLSKIVCDLLLSLTRQADDIGTDAAAVVDANIVDMIGMLLSEGRDRTVFDGTSVRWAIHRRAVAYMLEALSRPDLTPDLIARSVGISTRYLHRIFQDTGESVAETLMRMRLERCMQMLTDPQLRPRSIKEIAFDVGFKNQSHCASTFKARFGVSPRDVRDKSRGDQPRCRFAQAESK